MQITSKFAGKCRNCGGQIAKGSRINWSRGDGAKHLQCDPNQIVKDGKTRGQLADEWDREHAGDMSAIERFEQMRVSPDYRDVPEDAILQYAREDTQRNPYR